MDCEELWTALSQEWNALVQGIRERFPLNVYSNEADEHGQPLWTVEYPDGKQTGFKRSVDALLAGIDATYKK